MTTETRVQRERPHRPEPIMSDRKRPEWLAYDTRLSTDDLRWAINRLTAADIITDNVNSNSDTLPGDDVFALRAMVDQVIVRLSETTAKLDGLADRVESFADEHVTSLRIGSDLNKPDPDQISAVDEVVHVLLRYKAPRVLRLGYCMELYAKALFLQSENPVVARAFEKAIAMAEASFRYLHAPAGMDRDEVPHKLSGKELAIAGIGLQLEDFSPAFLGRLNTKLRWAAQRLRKGATRPDGANRPKVSTRRTAGKDKIRLRKTG